MTEFMSVVEKKEITIAEAKTLLETKAEELDPLQRRVLDYTIKFAKTNAEYSEKIVTELVEKSEIDRSLAVQIVNCMPNSISEIRTFLGRQRIISEEAVENILRVIEKYRTPS
jgi:DNA-directed RNA polymerase subunit F